VFKNSPLEKDVIARLEDDPRIADSAEIAVAGDGGIVRPRGTVESFSGRRAAELLQRRAADLVILAAIRPVQIDLEVVDDLVDALHPAGIVSRSSRPRRRTASTRRRRRRRSGTGSRRHP
jgi:hypothetical protein